MSQPCLQPLNSLVQVVNRKADHFGIRGRQVKEAGFGTLPTMLSVAFNRTRTMSSRSPWAS
jgi:hypothetical protein